MAKTQSLKFFTVSGEKNEKGRLDNFGLRESSIKWDKAQFIARFWVNLAGMYVHEANVGL
jgi:hypothetical protein